MDNNIGKKEIFSINTENVKINNFVPDKTWIIIGKGTGRTIRMGTTATFNWFQRKMWKFLLNINIEDIKEGEI